MPAEWLIPLLLIAGALFTLLGYIAWKQPARLAGSFRWQGRRLRFERATQPARHKQTKLAGRSLLLGGCVLLFLGLLAYWYV